MHIKRALFGIVAVAGLLLGLVGTGAAPASAGISHVGGDATGRATTMEAINRVGAD